jgi:hypothetical protein
VVDRVQVKYGELCIAIALAAGPSRWLFDRSGPALAAIYLESWIRYVRGLEAP